MAPNFAIYRHYQRRYMNEFRHSENYLCSSVRQAAAAALNHVNVYWILQYIGVSVS